tara:strand:- start:378 stop:497 length:120 start_codon:yes stop_codon:yes gene_type:complete
VFIEDTWDMQKNIMVTIEDLCIIIEDIEEEDIIIEQEDI